MIWYLVTFLCGILFFPMLKVMAPFLIKALQKWIKESEGKKNED